MVPVCFLIVFIPYIKKKWGLLVLLVAIVSCLVSLGFRIHVIKVVIALLIIILYYLKFIKTRIVNIFFILLIFTPLILLTLGLNGDFK